MPQMLGIVEDVNHVLRLCAFALDVWAVLHYDSPPHEDQIGLHEWLSWMFDTYNTTKHLEIAITLWTLWYANNKLVHEGTHQGVGELVAFICGYCAELAALTTVSLRSNSSALVKWSLPPLNMVKVNADANGFPFNSLEGDSRAIIKKLVDVVEDLSEISALTWEAKELPKALRA
ncbi:hypothetical protein Golob_020398, partial [Gossypium lobatum]|nr:hypothetical protein [Gossypium lobatum]